MQLLLYLFNCPYLNPQVVSLLLFEFSSPSHCRGASKWLYGVELLAEVKPQQPFLVPNVMLEGFKTTKD